MHIKGSGQSGGECGHWSFTFEPLMRIYYYIQKSIFTTRHFHKNLLYTIL